MMKKTVFLLGALLSLGLGASCTTMYDSYGRPSQVITPEGAAVTALAAGVLGYAIADNQRSSRHHHYYRGRGYHRGHGGYYGRYYR